MLTICGQPAIKKLNWNRQKRCEKLIKKEIKKKLKILTGNVEQQMQTQKRSWKFIIKNSKIHQLNTPAAEQKFALKSDSQRGQSSVDGGRQKLSKQMKLSVAWLCIAQIHTNKYLASQINVKKVKKKINFFFRKTKAQPLSHCQWAIALQWHEDFWFLFLFYTKWKWKLHLNASIGSSVWSTHIFKALLY